MARWLPRERLRERLLYFALVPAICIAVLLLGAAALRTNLQAEKASQQTVFDATLSLAKTYVDTLDKMIIAQDNAVMANVDVSALSTIAGRWLLSAARETPTVRAVLVIDLERPALEVRSFVSRAVGPEDDRFRRMLISRILPRMDLTTEPTDELRHLHEVFEQDNYLLSYWQRSHAGRRYLVVAWHYVDKLVADLMPKVYGDIDPRNNRMNVIDQRGSILYGPPIQAGGFTVGVKFPTTLYNWRLQVALTSAEELAQRAVKQRQIQLAVVGMAMLIAVFGVVIVVRASIREHQLAELKSDFVANVSHELKTPLSSVRMFGELLLTGRVASEDKRREYVKIIVTESERLSSLLENVLDFAKVERGKDAYEFAPGDLAETVIHAVDVLRYRAEQQDIEIVTETAPSPAVFDARAIELAVVNVLDNALKYAKNSPSIQILVSPQEDSESPSEVLVRIADEGPGISIHDQKRIFDRFTRGHGAQDQHVRGSGIGLALVKHIAESHGGHVSVKSPWTAEGHGTAFELRLPSRPPGCKASLDLS